MQISNNLKEIREHGNTAFPFAQYEFKQENNIIITEHWHDEAELLYVKSGTLSVTVNKKIYTCKKGELIFINPGELHSITGSNIHYYAFVFKPNMLSFSDDDAVQKLQIRPFTEGKIRFFAKPEIVPDMKMIIEHITAVNTEQSPGYMLETKALLLMLINRLLCKKFYTENESSARKMEAEARLKAIVAYIGEHFSEPVSLDDIASEFHMSPKYFCRFFKSRFHKTFIEYLNLVRIENAMRLMDSSDISVTEAALSSGFSNMSYFTRVFKNAVGRTPSEYKKL